MFLLSLSVPPSGTSQTSLPIAGVTPLYDFHPAGGGTPRAGTVYSIVFDLNSPPGLVGAPSPGLAVIAGLLNTYARYGVPQEHRRFVVVLRNDFVELTETDASYQQRHAGRTNPDSPLLGALIKAGVVFAVDTPSLGRASLATSDLQPGVRVDVAANLTFLDLEAEGYVYTSTRSLQ